MKLATWAICVALLVTAARAQTAPPQEPAPPARPPMQGCCMHSHQDGVSGHNMSGPGMAMPDMKAQVEKMRATLDQMKANLAKVGDPAVKQQAQFDVELWQAMVEHMEGMVKMMSQAPDMPMGNMQGGKGCCGGMHKGDGCCGGMKSADGRKCEHGGASAKSAVPAE